MYKSKLFPFFLVLIVIMLITGLRSYGGRRAVEWFEERYGIRVTPGVATVQSVGMPKLFEKSWPVWLEYQGVEFLVDFRRNYDDFAEPYTASVYLQMIRDNYPDENLSSIRIQQIYPMGVPYTMPLDYLFWLEVVFDDTVDSKEAFAAAADTLLQALNQAGLTNCDTAETFATVGDRQMQLTFHPFRDPSYQELYELIGGLPVPEWKPAFP